VPQDSADMSIEDMYHVMSVAFLLMEDERKAFATELTEVEDFYSKQSTSGANLALQIILRRTVSKQISHFFHAWHSASNVITQAHFHALSEKKKRLARISSGAKAFLTKILANLILKTFKSWQLLVMESKISKLTEHKVAANLLATEVTR